MALRQRAAELGRFPGLSDLEQLEWSHQDSIQDVVAFLRSHGVVVESGARAEGLRAHLSGLRLLPLRTFAADPASPTGIVAIARTAKATPPATTPVTALARDVLMFGPTCEHLLDALGAVYADGGLPDESADVALDRIAQELPRLMADGAAYLDLPAKDCTPGNPVDPVRLSLECGADTDLCVLPIGFPTDASDDIPTALSVAGRKHTLDPDQGAMWALVRDLDTFAASGEGALQELFTAARDRGLRNAQYALDTLEQRGLVHRVRGPRALKDLGRLVFRPLLVGLVTRPALRRSSGAEPARFLGASRTQRGTWHSVAQIDVLGLALWSSSRAEMATLAHTVALLFPSDGDLDMVRFVLDRIRALVRDGAAYLDVLEAPTSLPSGPSLEVNR